VLDPLVRDDTKDVSLQIVGKEVDYSVWGFLKLICWDLYFFCIMLKRRWLERLPTVSYFFDQTLVPAHPVCVTIQISAREFIAVRSFSFLREYDHVFEVPKLWNINTFKELNISWVGTRRLRCYNFACYDLLS
jgi:hypothetical protein